MLWSAAGHDIFAELQRRAAQTNLLLSEESLEGRRRPQVFTPPVSRARADLDGNK